MKKFVVITLGCRTNQYESQGYVTQLKKMGYSPAKQGELVGLCIINTCSVTHDADVSSRNKIRKALKDFPSAKVVVTGCFAENDQAKSLLKDDRVIYVPNLEKEKLIEHVFICEEQSEIPPFCIDRYESNTRAFLKVQDGCNNYCSYCIIPQTRGKSRSRNVTSIVEEAKRIVHQGHKEIVLTGINIGDFYDESAGCKLSGLMGQLEEIKGLKRLRISSIDPHQIDDEMIQVMKESKIIAPSMHISLQSGSDSILKQMNRRYDISTFLDTIEKLSRAMEKFTLTTDVIVGFPSESEKDFLESCQILEKVPLAKAHIFPFSVRPNTRAAKLAGQLSKDAIQSRVKKLLQIADTKALQIQKTYLGDTTETLLEQKEKLCSERYIGHTDNFFPVIVEGETLSRSDWIKVKLLSVDENGSYVGEKIDG